MTGWAPNTEAGSLADGVVIGTSGEITVTTTGGVATVSIPDPFVLPGIITGVTQPMITQVINAQTGTSYTLLDADHGKLVTMDNSGAITLTVPTGLRADFACVVLQKGFGGATFTPSGTTINEFASLTKTAGQWALASLSHLGSDVYILQGKLA